jgi:DNA invertase Pin-like site-specific DNA recombinase
MQRFNAMTKAIAYLRVSTEDQHIENQRAAIRAAGFDIEREFIDEATSGTTKGESRPGFAAMLEYLREGDTLAVFALDRLGRDALDVLGTINALSEKGVRLVILKQQFDTSTPAGRLALTMFAAFAEFEHGLRRERQQEGIRRARAEGKYQGRKSKLSEEQRSELIRRYATGECRAALAREYGIDRATVHRVVKAQEAQTK